MRILLAHTLYPSTLHPEIVGGAETFSRRLCEALVARGHVVQVVRCGPVGSHWPEETMNGVGVSTLPVHNLYSPWQNRADNPIKRAVWHLIDDRSAAAPEFGAVLDTFRPDVLHSNGLAGLTTGLWSMAKARGIPIVHTLHDYYLTCARSLRFRGGARCVRTCTSCRLLTGHRREASALVDTVVSVSDRTLAVHRENGLFSDEARCITIRNPPPKIGIDIGVVDAVGRPLVFGFLGRSCAEKGSFELAAAFKRIAPGLARLVIAGHADDATRARIIEEAGGAEISFLGFVPPESFFKQIDVMVLPSLWEEPSPMVIGESFAYARPVVGSRRGGIPELVSDDRMGWLYEPGEGRLAALVRAILQGKTVVAAKSEFLRLKSDRRDFDDLIAEYLDVYRDTMQLSEAAKV